MFPLSIVIAPTTGVLKSNDLLTRYPTLLHVLDDVYTQDPRKWSINIYVRVFSKYYLFASLYAFLQHVPDEIELHYHLSLSGSLY